MSPRAQWGKEERDQELGGSQEPSGRKSSTASTTLHHCLPQEQKWMRRVEPRPPVLSLVYIDVQGTQGELHFFRAAIVAARARLCSLRARGRRRACAVDGHLIGRLRRTRTASLCRCRWWAGPACRVWTAPRAAACTPARQPVARVRWISQQSLLFYWLSQKLKQLPRNIYSSENYEIKSYISSLLCFIFLYS